MPVLYFVRHGETDFNVEQRLQGQYQTRLNARGKQQALSCGGLLHDLLARDGRSPPELSYVASPLVRARETMELVRTALGLDPHAYDIDDRLMEISYGEWEGFTLPEIEARNPHVLEERERDKWDFAPPGGESYRAVAKRVGEWYATVTRDTVVVAHGGTARALFANFHIMSADEATHAEVAHGVIYVFSNGTMARYA